MCELINIDFEKPKDYSLKIKTLINLQFDFFKKLEIKGETPPGSVVTKRIIKKYYK